MKLQKYQTSVFTEVSVALADACSNLRGYVTTDVAAGLAIISLEHNVVNSLNQVSLHNIIYKTYTHTLQKHGCYMYVWMC